MNERIKELEKQAIVRVPATCTDPLTFRQVPLFNGSIQVFKDEFSLEKFAELLVKECARVITDLPNKMVNMELSQYNEGWRNGRLLAKEHIEHHFGITE